MSHELIRYEAACHALAECKAVDEVKAWADKAAAMQAYGRMAKDKTLEVDAAEIRIRAERRLGEMIAGQKAEGGLNRGAKVAGNSPGMGQGSPVVVGDDRRPKLADAGISKDLSSRAQKLAAVPKEEFEREVGTWRKRVTAEGARVSSRLEKAGERHMKTAAEQSAEDAHGDFDPLAELEKAQKEIEALSAQIAAAEADDLKAEALKWRRAYDAAVRGQSDAMSRAAKFDKELSWHGRQLQRIGKAIGETDPTKIAPKVEAMMRQAA